jgi:hypothetical protein
MSESRVSTFELELTPTQQLLMIRWAATSARALMTNDPREAMPGSSDPSVTDKKIAEGAVRYEHGKLKIELDKRSPEDPQRREAWNLMVNIIDAFGLSRTFHTMGLQIA